MPGDLRLRAVRNAAPSHFGQADPANAGAVIDAPAAPARPACPANCTVTGPVHKAVNEGGIAYSGTTELADQAGVKVG